MPVLLQINVCSGIYSTGTIVDEIATLAKKNGWKSYVAFGRAARKGNSELIKIGNKTELFLHILRSRLLDQHGLGSSNATNKLIFKIKEITPDVVHLHNIHGYYLNYRLLFEFLNTRSIPVVVTLHDCWLFTGHCSHFAQINCLKWQTRCENCKALNSYPESYIDNSSENFMLKKELLTACPDLHIVAVSDWLANMVQLSFLKGKDITVIHNGVDLSVFKHTDVVQNLAQLAVFRDKFVMIGVASVWREDKGLKDYIELSSYLREDEVICLVGVGDRLIETMPSGIIGIPKIENIKDLVSLYSRAEVLLSLSYAETFGLTIAEGFACGIPAIVYDNTAQPELITPDTGFVVQKGRYEEIIRAVDQIKKMGRSYYSDACRLRAEQYYDKYHNYDKYIDLYNKLLDN